MTSRRQTVLPFGERIRQRRERLGLTQAALARKAGVSTRTISRAENGQHIDLEFLHFIAEALGVTFRDVACPEGSDRDDPQTWLVEMIESDRTGDFANAARIGEALVERLLPTDHPLFVEACVRLAIVYDHQRRWEAGLHVLDKCLLGADEQDNRRDIAWARFQRGVLRRVFAENLLLHSGRRFTTPIKTLLASAARDLQEAGRASDPGMQVAAGHQMGVLHLLEGRYERALETFEECLRHRSNGKADELPEMCVPYRRAYEHRRIAQCHARMAEQLKEARSRNRARAKAREHFALALRLATESQHKRLQDDLRRDLAAFGFELNELPQ
jgi:transcriptional regulator with XRE-family HTH domain